LEDGEQHAGHDDQYEHAGQDLRPARDDEGVDTVMAVSTSADPGAGSGAGAVPSRPPLLRRVVVIGAIVVAAAFAFGRCAVPGETLEDGAGIAGTYVVNGVDVIGTEYSGTVRITELGGGEYRIDWLIPDGFPTGVGRLDGDVLTVGWAITEPVRASGTAVYTLREDGSLVGTRAFDGVDGVVTEEIFPEP
jgi:hypothetical protein